MCVHLLLTAALQGCFGWSHSLAHRFHTLLEAIRVRQMCCSCWGRCYKICPWAWTCSFLSCSSVSILQPLDCWVWQIYSSALHLGPP